MAATTQPMTDHFISVLVEDHPGVMAKVTGMMARRGFNIESLAAGPCEKTGMFRLTIVVKGDDHGIEQIQKQLYKIVDTVKVAPVESSIRLEREIGLVKIRTGSGNRSELLELVKVFRGNVLDVTPAGCIVEITGSSEKVDSFIQLFPPDQIVEVSRTGLVAMKRWDRMS